MCLFFVASQFLANHWGNRFIQLIRIWNDGIHLLVVYDVIRSATTFVFGLHVVSQSKIRSAVAISRCAGI